MDYIKRTGRRTSDSTCSATWDYSLFALEVAFLARQIHKRKAEWRLLFPPIFLTCREFGSW